MIWTQIKSLYLSGLSITEIAAEINMSRSGVGYAVKKLGISRSFTNTMRNKRWKPLKGLHYAYVGDEVAVA